MKKKTKNAQKRLNRVELQIERVEKMKNRVSNVRNSSWMDFQGTMAILIAAGKTSSFY